MSDPTFGAPASVGGATLDLVPNADASDIAARPYGLLGLVVSTLAILVLSAVVCVLFATVAFGVVAAISGVHRALELFWNIDPSAGRDVGFETKLNIVVGLAVYAAVSAVILATALFRGRRGWRDLVAWRPWHPIRGARLFWSLFALTLVYSVGADKLVTALYPQAQDWTPTPSGLLWDASFFLLAAVFAPLTEELMFRGWLYTSLRLSIGAWAAILLTSALFALAHWEKTHLYALAIFPVGLALGVIREKTGSIAASISFHALYNGFATALLLLTK